MPTVTLFPQTCAQRAEFKTAWSAAGSLAPALKVDHDGNFAGGFINLGDNDSNSLDATVWRQSDGSAFSWFARRIDSVQVQMGVRNTAPSSSANLSFAAYLTDTAISFSSEVFNGVISAPIVASSSGATQLVTVYNAAHAQFMNALKVDNAMLTMIFYNHSWANSTMEYDIAKVIVSYTELQKPLIPWTEV